MKEKIVQIGDDDKDFDAKSNKASKDSDYEI